MTGGGAWKQRETGYHHAIGKGANMGRMGLTDMLNWADTEQALVWHLQRLTPRGRGMADAGAVRF